MDHSTFAGRMQQECRDRHSALIGLEHGALRALRTPVWVIHAPSEYRHFQVDADGAPAVETLRGSPFVPLGGGAKQ